MIYRLSFPEGERLPIDANDIGLEIGALIVANLSEFRLLEPGTYPITPAVWTKNKSIHELTVLDSGTGIHRMYPRYEDTGYIESDDEGGLKSFHRGGKTNEIDSRRPTAVIAGGHPRKPDLQLFEVIRFLPVYLGRTN